MELPAYQLIKTRTRGATESHQWQREHSVTVEFNHTIVWAHDSKASANFLSEMLGLPAPNQ
jgi:hypothetical protein